jgi:hypothetical protein
MPSLPNRGVDPLYTTVTPIFYPNSSDHATGFLYMDLGDSDAEEINQLDKQTYLITNHYAVADGEGNPICDSFRIITRPNSQDLAKLRYHDIELKDEDGSSQWLEHPEGSEIDVVAIPIDIDLSESGTRVISNQLRIPDN